MAVLTRASCMLEKRSADEALADTADPSLALLERTIPDLGATVRVIRFHAEWCPRCPEVAEACAALETGFLMQHLSIDVSDERSEEIVRDYNVKQLPCVLLVSSDNSTLARLDGSSPTDVRDAVKHHCQRRPLEMDADF